MRIAVFALILCGSLIAMAIPSPHPRVVCSPWPTLTETERSQNTLYLQNLQTQGQVLRQKYPLNLSLLNDATFMDRLARGILNNETSCEPNRFIFWNDTESFPSLGLLHAIWYPRDERGALTESFPRLIQFLRSEVRRFPATGVNVPAWLNRDDIGKSPWNTKEKLTEAFKNAQALRDGRDLSRLTAQQQNQAEKMRDVYDFLRHPSVLAMQARFAGQRLQNSVYSIIAAAENQQPSAARAIYTQLQRLTTTEEGIFSLIDYTSFKGEGLNPGEVTAIGGHSWGLKKVLEQMATQKNRSRFCNPRNSQFDDSKCANVQFTQAAYQALMNRAKNSATEGSACQRQEIANLAENNGRRGGWLARLQDNYLPGQLANSRCSDVPVRFSELATPRTVVSN